jgi:hypothetical protein
MVGGLPAKASASMEFQELGGVAKVGAFLVQTLGLEGAELVERVLILAREAGAVEREFG